MPKFRTGALPCVGFRPRGARNAAEVGCCDKADAAGRFSPLGPRGIGLVFGPSNERLELLMKRGDWRQAADRFRLLPDCVPCRFGEVFPLKNDSGPEVLKGDIVALL
jgi:hypothetical protein